MNDMREREQLVFVVCKMSERDTLQCKKIVILFKFEKSLFYYHNLYCLIYLMNDAVTFFVAGLSVQ